MLSIIAERLKNMNESRLWKITVLVIAVVTLATVFFLVGKKSGKEVVEVPSKNISNVVSPVKTAEILEKQKFGFSVQIPEGLKYEETEYQNPEPGAGGYVSYVLQIEDPALKSEAIWDTEKEEYVSPKYGGIFMTVVVFDKSKDGTLGEMEVSAPNGMDFKTETPADVDGLKGKKFDDTQYSVTDGKYQYKVGLWTPGDGEVTPEMKKRFEDVVRTIEFFKN